MSESFKVQEAGQSAHDRKISYAQLAYTVATEPERMAAAECAAVVKALRTFGLMYCNEYAGDFADAIEDGADW